MRRSAIAVTGIMTKAKIIGWQRRISRYFTRKRINKIIKRERKWLKDMNTCKKCGKPTSNVECLGCRYRQGGRLHDNPEAEHDLVDQMLRHSKKHFRDGFTLEQILQVSPSER